MLDRKLRIIGRMLSPSPSLFTRLSLFSRLFASPDQRHRTLAMLYKDERCSRLPVFPMLEKARPFRDITVKWGAKFVLVRCSVVPICESAFEPGLR